MKKYLAEIKYRETDGKVETKTIFDYKDLKAIEYIIVFYNQLDFPVFILNKDCFICLNIEECDETK